VSELVGGEERGGKGEREERQGDSGEKRGGREKGREMGKIGEVVENRMWR